MTEDANLWPEIAADRPASAVIVWLVTPHDALEGAKPIELMRQNRGQEVLDLIDATWPESGAGAPQAAESVSGAPPAKILSRLSAVARDVLRAGSGKDRRQP